MDPDDREQYIAEKTDEAMALLETAKARLGEQFWLDVEEHGDSARFEFTGSGRVVMHIGLHRFFMESDDLIVAWPHGGHVTYFAIHPDLSSEMVKVTVPLGDPSMN